MSRPFIRSGQWSQPFEGESALPKLPVFAILTLIVLGSLTDHKEHSNVTEDVC